MKVLAILALLGVVLTWYAIWGREILKRSPWFQPLFDWIEPWEVTLYKKSQTILFARLKMISGVVLMVLTQAGTIDLTPIMPLVPDAYEPYLRIAFNLLPLVLTLMGAVDEKLRNATTLPIEVVAVTDKDVAENPKVAAAVETAVAAKAEAVAAVQEAKAT
ncbi:hypothetical protein ABIA95_000160 [Bradyrhizobium sp. LA8.1]|uniref:hypothetical protein n=1 Tax=unclassified Bradyrhizobium TaxID=2631580 RepID=UPI0033915767